MGSQSDILYLSGPMTGLPDFNHPAFDFAAELLRGYGFEVLNPAEQPKRPTWEEYMRHDIKLLMDATVLIQLAGWKQSRGALIEAQLALALGIEIVPIGVFCERKAVA